MTQQHQTKPWLGCIADDYTGATDLASFLVAGGLRTIQINDLPDIETLKSITDVDAIVVAMKTRTMPVDEAVELSRSALKLLEQAGCEKFYFKYCSTFDSTAQGNIGPVIDALLSDLSETSTILCPALPVNGRTVYQGHLFVFDQLLNESPMKNHPLTPMTDSYVPRMIEQQGQGKAKAITYQTLEQGTQTLTDELTKQAQNYNYLVLDSLNKNHLKTVGESIKNFKLITGGSGLAEFLAAEMRASRNLSTQQAVALAPIDAPALVLSGSCSAMTQAQVKQYRQNHPTFELDVDAVISGEQNVSTVLTWLEDVYQQAPLITATAAPEKIKENQTNHGTEKVATAIENLLSSVAVAANKRFGVQNIVVAGGETSGAVVKALNVSSFYIGKTIAPGVPMVQTYGDQPLNLALKSGNFGDQEFFNKAIETLSK